jgi:arsenate reductase (thioredoxin)
MAKQNVLFICVHNSARSQMAEAWLNSLCGDRFAAESAGLEPGTINPLVVEVMREAGIDLSQKKTQAVFDVWKSGKLFQYVIAVCAESEEKGCPIFPGVTTRLSWPFPDPSQVTGSREERLQQVRTIRDSIRTKIEQWCEEMRG